MNQTFGGFNPYAVDVAIKSGAKIIWMPTNSATNHLYYYGSGEWKSQKLTKERLYPMKQGISPIDEEGKFLPQVKEVIKLIAQSNIVMATGHCSTQESKKVVKEALSLGVKKIIITHPDFEVVNMPLRDQKEFADQGVYIERTVLPTTGSWKTLTIKEIIARFREVPYEKTIISSDLGQINTPPPVQGYRMFIETLIKHGIPSEENRKMTCENPKKLLGIN